MNNFSVFALSTAVALFLASAASSAQDKPNTATAKKSNASVDSLSKTAKLGAQAPGQLNSTSTKALNERSDAKPSAPVANQVAPAAERAHESCHGKDSDA